MSKKKTKEEDRTKPLKNSKKKDLDYNDQDPFDFGGIPKGLDLKKNLGCGG